MRIIIDMQGAQSSGSRSRGIGRYTRSLVQAILRNAGEHEIVLVLNGAFEEASLELRKAFPQLSHDCFRSWTAPGPVDSLTPANAWRRQSAQLLREAFVASLLPDYVLMTSLFEGLSDDAVTSVALLNRAVPTAVVLYDLIPLIQRDTYLTNVVVENWYESKLDSLRRADLLLAISASSRQEAIDELGFDKESCINISTAADSHFVPMTVAADVEAQVRALYGLRGRYVMYTGGIDLRKNIEGLIIAYAALADTVRAGLQLAIVCSIQPHQRIELETRARTAGLTDGELVLTGYVPEEDLVLLYNLCALFVFPSWHEGFGLPALEAMSCGRAVIAADTSSLPEVIGRADALFDPRDNTAITGKLAQVLTDNLFRHDLEQHGLQQARQFSWDITARRALTAIEQAHLARHQGAVPSRPHRRPRLAYVSPLPPERSGIAEYSAELLPELSRHYDIDVIAPQTDVSDPWIRANCHLRGIEWFRTHAGMYDRILYHMGNSTYHAHMFELMEEIPGVVVLHDFFLSGVMSYLEMTGTDPGIWLAALYESHGYAAVAQRFKSDTGAAVVAYPCNLRVLRAALNVVVHSNHSMDLARFWYGPAAAERWRVVPHMRRAVGKVPRQSARRALGLDECSFVVCSFGLLGPSKLNLRLLSAWLASRLGSDPDCTLVFVGENAGGDDGAALLAAIAASPSRDRIHITGWADGDLYRSYLAAGDVAVQLRVRSRGETSGTVLDCMNYGLPTIVNAHGSLADLPDDAVIKLPDSFADSDLAAALQRLRDLPVERARLGERSREIIRTAHAPRMCGDHYAHAIEEAYRADGTGTASLLAAVAQLEPRPADAHDIDGFSQAVAGCMPLRMRLPQHLVEVDPAAAPDHSAVTLTQRLVEREGSYRIEPVYMGEQLRYARGYTLRLLGCPSHAMVDEVADIYQGDTFFALPLENSGERSAFLQHLASRGVHVVSAAYPGSRP
jgi:glycosyltransferase involved in cell wall biosynthesis